MKRACNFVDAEDGSFFMTVHDFIGHFGSYDVAYYHDNFVYSYIAATFNPAMHKFFEFSLPSKTKAYLRCHFEDKRCHTPDGSKEPSDGYKYSECFMTLCKKLEGGRLEKVNEPHNNQYWGGRSVHLHKDMMIELEKGDYLLKVVVNWYDDEPHECVISGYASNEIAFKGDIWVDDFEDQEAASLGRKMDKPAYEKNGLKYFQAWIGQTTFFYYLRNDGSKEGQLTHSYKDLGDFRIQSHKKGSGWEVRLKPGEDTVVRLVRPNDKWKMFGSGSIMTKFF